MVVDEFDINKSDLFRSSTNSPSDFISTLFVDKASETSHFILHSELVLSRMVKKTFSILEATSINSLMPS